MLCEGRLLGIITEPPCTTFSVMRRPALRDRDHPFGFDPKDPQTDDGNMLAHRGFQSLAVAEGYGAAAMLETPNSSKMKNLPSWRNLAGRRRVSTVRCDSCRFGSPRLKSFKFLGVNVNMEEVALRCRCCKHLQVAGQYTKKSATYTDALADAIASVFAKAILTIEAARNEVEDYEVDGKENVLANEVVKSSAWKVNGSWAFKSRSHINLLELAALVELARRVARHFGACRVLAFVDSAVVRGACSKGRSASAGISKLLRRFCSICLASGLYFTTPFCPTRLNPSDDPTRTREVRDPIDGSWLDEWSDEDLYKLATKKPLRRWISNWTSLVIKLIGPRSMDLADRSLYRSFPLHASYIHHGSMDFDASLGFPGEGPLSSSPLTLPRFGLGSSTCSGFSSCLVCLLVCLQVSPVVHAMPLQFRCKGCCPCWCKTRC